MKTMVKRLRPFFKYFGSKYSLAPKYPAPTKRGIVEPFAGSASYSTLYYYRDVTLSEVDVDVCLLWRWLINARRLDVAALPYALATGSDIRELDIPYEAKLLIRAWQRVGMSKCWTVSKWNGANTDFWCKETRDAIADQVDSIKHWRIQLGDYQTIEAKGHTVFVDPPYIGQPKYPDTQPLCYTSLAEKVREWEQDNQVIVCEAQGATWLPFDKTLPASAGMARRARGGANFADVYYTNEGGTSETPGVQS